MVIYYYTISGNTKFFAEQFEQDGHKAISIHEADHVDEPYVLFTPTYNYGRIPAPVDRFLTQHGDYIKGVVGFGDRGWGSSFARAGDLVSYKFQIPLLRKVEKRGTPQDFENVRRKLNGKTY